MLFPRLEEQSNPAVVSSPCGTTNAGFAERRITHELLESLIAAQERELGNIARELHDDVCQRLSMLSLKIERLAKAWAKGQTHIGEQLEQLWQECSVLTGNVQALSHELHPSLLDNLGLVPAIKGFCRELSEQSGVVVEFTSKDVPDCLSREVSLAFFRLVQEALHNALKYSHGDYFHVHLQTGQGQIELEVCDLGIGFDVAGASRKGGIGLISMRERIHVLEGKITIESKPNHGTRIRASVPLAGRCRRMSAVPS